MLAMAMALMVEPAVLLLDEPSAGLSPVAAERLFDAIAQINKDGVSIAMVEQNANEALAISDRAYILVDGKNSRTGPPRRSPPIRRSEGSFSAADIGLVFFASVLRGFTYDENHAPVPARGRHRSHRCRRTADPRQRAGRAARSSAS